MLLGDIRYFYLYLPFDDNVEIISDVAKVENCLIAVENLVSEVSAQVKDIQGFQLLLLEELKLADKRR